MSIQHDNALFLGLVLGLADADRADRQAAEDAAALRDLHATLAISRRQLAAVRAHDAEAAAFRAAVLRAAGRE